MKNCRHKLFWILCLCALSCEVWATEAPAVFDLSADEVKAQGEQVIAQGNAFLLYGDSYMVADRIIYDKQTQKARLEGKVKIYQGNTLYLDVSEVELFLQDKQIVMQNLYLQSPEGIWVAAKKGSGEDKKYQFKRGVISGCDIRYPLWHLNVSSGQYNADKSRVSMWNSRLYIGAVPILYVPYFTAPTGNVRKTGLIYPQFAYSSKQGFMYQQPFFLAPFNRWDMTFSPQFRTSRGFGGDLEFRFADQNNAVAILQMRYFQNFNQYVIDNDLANQNIYGFNFQYGTKNIFTKQDSNSSTQDGFYANISYMNDLEYMRLKSLNASFDARLYNSRVNYFINSQNHFIGGYLKYYLDLSQTNNDKVFQTLPQLQYHHYTDSLFFKNLLYTFDLQSKNITRPEGYGYIQTTASLPIGINFAIFKDYLSIGANLKLYGTLTNLQNATDVLDVFTNSSIDKMVNYAGGNYSISFNSDIVRPYQHFFHSLHLEGIFSGKVYRYTSDALSDERYEAYAEKLLTNSPGVMERYWNPNEMLDLTENKHKVDLKLSQYFYGKKGKELFYWRLYQRIFLQDQSLTQTQILRNELGFSPFSSFNMNTSVFYSWTLKNIREASINANLNRWGLNAGVTYYFRLDTFYEDSVTYSTNKTGFLRGRVGYDFGYFRFDANVGYDMGIKYLKDWYVTISKDIRCFGIGLKLAQDVRPVLTASGDVIPVSNQYVKLELRFVPLTNYRLTYRFKE